MLFSYLRASPGHKKKLKNSLSEECKESWRCCAYKNHCPLLLSFSITENQAPLQTDKTISATNPGEHISPGEEKKKYLRWAEAWKWFWGPFLSPQEYFALHFFWLKMQVIPLCPRHRRFSRLSAHAQNVYCNLLRLVTTSVSEPFKKRACFPACCQGDGPHERRSTKRKGL